MYFQATLIDINKSTIWQLQVARLSEANIYSQLVLHSYLQCKRIITISQPFINHKQIHVMSMYMHYSTSTCTYHVHAYNIIHVYVLKMLTWQNIQDVHPSYLWIHNTTDVATIQFGTYWTDCEYCLVPSILVLGGPINFSTVPLDDSQIAENVSVYHPVWWKRINKWGGANCWSEGLIHGQPLHSQVHCMNQGMTLSDSSTMPC